MNPVKKNKRRNLPRTDIVLLITLIALLTFYYTDFIPQAHSNNILFIVSLLATLPVIWSAAKSIREKRISVDLLAGIALIASIFAKEWASAAFINLMLTSARIFGFYTESKARAAIESLLKFRPQKIKIKRGEKIVEINPEEVKVGDLVVIESGDRVPIDGVVVDGAAEIDQSSLTGESLPVSKGAGDKVFSPTLNTSGLLVVRVEKVGRDTTLEKIIDLVENSQKNKSNLRTVADKFASWYISLTLIVAIIVFLVSKDIYLLLALLLVACADDIAIAVPLAFLAAIGYAARRGVIVKGGNYLEGLSKTSTIIFDKTGTLTIGKLKVREVTTFGKYQPKEVARLAGMTEVFSHHPVAKAITEYIKEQKIEIAKVDDFNEIPGKGTTATHQGRKIISGNLKFLRESGVSVSADELKKIAELQEKGFSVTLIGQDKALAGAVSCLDIIRPHTKDVMTKLKNLGIKATVMLTGDNEKTAKGIADEAGIINYHANLSPQDKLVYIKKYLNSKTKTVMVGDGVNDAAAIALADIGIAMGAIGSDTAIEAADIALMKDDLREIPEMVELSRYTSKITRQDFIIWGAVNFIGLILVFGRIIGPEGAAAYNFITDFLPLINSIRLFNLHLKL